MLNHVGGDGGGGAGAPEECADFGIVREHLLPVDLVFNECADFVHKSLRVAVVLDELLECKPVDAQIPETDVLDLYNSFRDCVGETAAHYEANNLRGSEQNSLKRGCP